MKKLTLLLVGVVLLFMNGCSTNKNISNDTNTADKYILGKGYSIISFEGEIEKYTLTKDKLLKAPYDNIWGVQNVAPDQYLNKEIIVDEFVVKNHPLDNDKNNDNKKTKLYIMLSENKVIGGYSIPDNDSVGGYYSLEGKSLEEATGLNYKDWNENWKKKYDSNQ